VSIRSVEEIRRRVQERVSTVRGRLLGGQQLGGGVLGQGLGIIGPPGRRIPEPIWGRLPATIKDRIVEARKRVYGEGASAGFPRLKGGVMDQPKMSVEVEPEQRKLAEERGMSVEW
jgi:hypothetical protein